MRPFLRLRPRIPLKQTRNSPPMTQARLGRLLIIVAILLVAVLLRERAIRSLRTDFDEPVYYEAGLRLADAIRHRDWVALASDDWHYEHPGLMKMLYAAAFLRYPYGAYTVPDLPELTELRDLAIPQRTLVFAGRRASMLFGLLTVALVAAVSPLAGALLAVHTYIIKYTSQIYLEAIPLLASTVCVLAYMRALEREAAAERGGAAWRWWALSAVALGITAAGKYIYCVAGLAVVADYGLRAAADRRPRAILTLLGWGGLSLLVFYVANNQLWLDPIGRLAASLRFHVAYPSSLIVRSADFPWNQPLIWLYRPMPSLWHPGVFLFSPDGLTAALGMLGSWPTWRAWGGRGRVVVLWWVIGLAILLLWPTKWPQYTLIIIVPLCLSAAEALRAFGRALRARGILRVT